MIFIKKKKTKKNERLPEYEQVVSVLMMYEYTQVLSHDLSDIVRHIRFSWFAMASVARVKCSSVERKDTFMLKRKPLMLSIGRELFPLRIRTKEKWEKKRKEKRKKKKTKKLRYALRKVVPDACVSKGLILAFLPKCEHLVGDSTMESSGVWNDRCDL